MKIEKYYKRLILIFNIGKPFSVYEISSDFAFCMELKKA